ncbi:TIGR03087 family PEP-CTERM/XrtA system glycosyltransferase [Planctomycetaceae bacterium SH139]
MTSKPSPKRLLMLTHRFPYPPNRGDRIRSYNLLKVLSEHFRVTLGSTTDEPVHQHELDHVQSLCDDLFVAPLGNIRRFGRALGSFAVGNSITEGMFASRQLARQINRWHEKTPFDAVLVFCSSMYPYVDKKSFAGVQRIVDLVDVDSQKWRQMNRQARGPKKFLYGSESKRVRKLEQRIADRTDAVALVSDSEADLFHRTVAVSKPSFGISNGVCTNYFTPRPQAAIHLPPKTLCSTTLSLVFTGVLDYAPNVEGIVWFCRNVLPKLSGVIDVQLSVVGRRPCRQVLELGSIPGVKIVGEVPDVRPHLHQADVAISPLKLARGIQNKVLEAMAAGMPVVVTPESAEGIDAVSGEQFFVADTVEAWCETLSRLASDPVLRTTVGTSARRLVKSEYSWSARMAKFVAIVNSLPHKSTVADAARLPSNPAQTGTLASPAT